MDCVQVPVEDPEPGVPRHGCQYHETEAMDACFFRHGVVPRLSDTKQAMVRSQAGSLAGAPFTCFPTPPLTRFDAKALRFFSSGALYLVCMEAGGKVTPTCESAILTCLRGVPMTRDVADGLPLFHGAAICHRRPWCLQ